MFHPCTRYKSLSRSEQTLQFPGNQLTRHFNFDRAGMQQWSRHHSLKCPQNYLSASEILHQINGGTDTWTEGNCSVALSAVSKCSHKVFFSLINLNADSPAHPQSAGRDLLSASPCSYLWKKTKNKASASCWMNSCSFSRKWGVIGRENGLLLK